MAKEIKSKTTIGNNAGGPPPAAPRAADVDPKQDAAPDASGPVMTYEERRAAIRAFIAEDPETETPRTPEETERLVDEHMANEHLPGPVPEGKLFVVQCYDTKGKPCGTPSERMTHEDAIVECNVRNATGNEPGTWWGVDHAPIEAK